MKIVIGLIGLSYLFVGMAQASVDVIRPERDIKFSSRSQCLDPILRRIESVQCTMVPEEGSECPGPTFPKPGDNRKCLL